MRGYDELHALLLSKSGIYNDPELLFTFDTIWHDYQKLEQGKKDLSKNGRKRIPDKNNRRRRRGG